MRAILLALAVLALPLTASAQQAAPPAQDSLALPNDTVLLTIFLKHDQSKTLGEIQDELKKSGFNDRFPPPGVEIVSWYVMMGIGQVVTLKLPPSKLREVNRIIEESAWGAYRTEFYPTYVLRPPTVKPGK